jgi:uncharacterized membrane protein YciS (DUF1049 family)
MRFLSFVLMVVLLLVVAAFAVQNNQQVTVAFYEWSVSASLAALVAVVYVLGMLTGWTVLGVVRRSLARAADR